MARGTLHQTGPRQRPETGLPRRDEGVTVAGAQGLEIDPLGQAQPREQRLEGAPVAGTHVLDPRASLAAARQIVAQIRGVRPATLPGIGMRRRAEPQILLVGPVLQVVPAAVSRPGEIRDFVVLEAVTSKLIGRLLVHAR